MNENEDSTPTGAPGEKLRTSGKSLITGYLLWLIGGLLGMHRFWMGRRVSGALLAAGTIISLTAWSYPATRFFGFLGIVGVVAWWAVDLLLITFWISGKSSL